VCNDVITQPLCPACHEEQVVAWLMERAPEHPEYLLTLTERREELEGLHGTTTCIKCKCAMDVCSYCYALHFYEWVKKELPEHAMSFATHFFDGWNRDTIEQHTRSESSICSLPKETYFSLLKIKNSREENKSVEKFHRK
jgi:succinate dehydrogenase/fumarate reductase-like Fe-S protein